MSGNPPVPQRALESHALDEKIAACRTATGAYRNAWALADKLTRELKALGLCGHCAIGEHMMCADYGCVCCGAGK